MNRTSASMRLAVLDQIGQLVVVHAVDDDGVDLEPAEEAMRGGDAGVDGRQLVEARQRAEAIGVQRVEADGDAAQARASGARRAWSASRTPLVVSARSASPGLAASIADERRQVAAQERLAAGQAQPVHAERDEDVDERADLLEVQDVLARQPGVVLLRHAVRAAQVAAVGDRQPQVAQRAF